MPAKSEDQRKAMAIALHAPGKLYKRNKAMLKMSKEQLSDFARKSTKGSPEFTDVEITQGYRKLKDKHNIKKSQWIVKADLEYRREKGEEDYKELKDDFNEYGYEISLIRKTNKFGQKSYGWDGTDKIIVSGGLGSFNDFKERKIQAKVMADALNKKCL